MWYKDPTDTTFRKSKVLYGTPLYKDFVRKSLIATGCVSVVLGVGLYASMQFRNKLWFEVPNFLDTDAHMLKLSLSSSYNWLKRKEADEELDRQLRELDSEE